MATHFSILIWRISRTEEPGKLKSIAVARVEHHWSNLACNMLCIYQQFNSINAYQVSTICQITTGHGRPRIFWEKKNGWGWVPECNLYSGMASWSMWCIQWWESSLVKTGGERHFRRTRGKEKWERETKKHSICWGSVSSVTVQFSHSVVSDFLWPHESQHARPPGPSTTPWVHSDSRPSSPWCHPAISSLVVPFSSCSQSLPASESSPMS